MKKAEITAFLSLTFVLLVSFVLGIGILILANLKKRKSAHLPNQKGVLEANE